MLRALVMDRSACVKELRTSLQNLRLCSFKTKLGPLLRNTAPKTDGASVWLFYSLINED